VTCIAVHHRQIAPMRKSSAYTRYRTMAAPAPEAASRAPSTHGVPGRGTYTATGFDTLRAQAATSCKSPR
jgi:hypothetical protein